MRRVFLVVCLVLLLLLGGALYLAEGGKVPAFASSSARTSVALDSSVVVGTPSISADFINQVLTAYHSAAMGEGQHIYDDGVVVGIDPVFALAFFMHESSFGLRGEAVVSLNPGNLRCLPDVKCQDNFAWFSSWDAGFQAWYALIRNLYVNSWHFTTVAQIITRYAPSADHNDEAAYVGAVMKAVETWRSGQVVVQGL